MIFVVSLIVCCAKIALSLPHNSYPHQQIDQYAVNAGSDQKGAVHQQWSSGEEQQKQASWQTTVERGNTQWRQDDKGQYTYWRQVPAPESEMNRWNSDQYQSVQSAPRPTEAAEAIPTEHPIGIYKPYYVDRPVEQPKRPESTIPTLNVNVIRDGDRVRELDYKTIAQIVATVLQEMRKVSAEPPPTPIPTQAMPTPTTIPVASFQIVHVPNSNQIQALTPLHAVPQIRGINLGHIPVGQIIYR